MLALREHPVGKSHRIIGGRTQPVIGWAFGLVGVALIDFTGLGEGRGGSRGGGSRNSGGQMGGTVVGRWLNGSLSVHGMSG